MDAQLPFDAEPETPRAPRVRQRLRSAHERAERRRKLIQYALLAGSFILMVDALVGENGYLATLRAQREFDAVARDLALVVADTNRMKDDVYRLQHDPAALEEAARRELGLVRPGETLIIVKPAAPADPAPGRR